MGAVVGPRACCHGNGVIQLAGATAGTSPPLFFFARSRLEAASTTLLGDLVVDLILPATPRTGTDIKSRHIGLDVKKRRAVQNVNILDMEDWPFTPNQPDQADPEGVRATRGPRRKHASRRIIQVWRDEKTRGFGPVEWINQIDVRKSLQVTQTLLELTKDLNLALDTLSKNRLNRCVLGSPMGAPDHPNWSVDILHDLHGVNTLSQNQNIKL
jgi:hypothetical protein